MSGGSLEPKRSMRINMMCRFSLKYGSVNKIYKTKYISVFTYRPLLPSDVFDSVCNIFSCLGLLSCTELRLFWSQPGLNLFCEGILNKCEFLFSLEFIVCPCKLSLCHPTWLLIFMMWYFTIKTRWLQYRHLLSDISYCYFR